MSKELVMYDTDERLILTESVGNKKSDKYIEKGTEVTFVKFVNKSFDLRESLVAFKHGDRTLVVTEDKLKVKNQRKVKKILKQMNRDIEKKYPRTRANSPNPFKRWYFTAYYYIVDKFGGSDE